MRHAKLFNASSVHNSFLLHLLACAKLPVNPLLGKFMIMSQVLEN